MTRDTGKDKRARIIRGKGKKARRQATRHKTGENNARERG